MSKYTFLLILVIVVVSFSTCSMTHIESNSNEYFEGVLTYKIDITLNKNLSKPEHFDKLELIKKAAGNNRMQFFKKGNYKRESYNNKEMLNYEIYRKNENQIYLFESGNNFISYYPADTKNFQTKYLAEGDTTYILNDNILKARYEELELINNQILTNKTIIRYVFIDSLKINPDWFSEYSQGGWNKLIYKYKSLPVETIIYHREKLLISKYSLVKVEYQSISDTLFQIPQNIEKRQLTN